MGGLRPLLIASLALLFALGGGRAAAQDMVILPDQKLRTIFTDDAATRTRLCDPRTRTVRPIVVLGELARDYSVNVLALPPIDRLGARAIRDTVEARLAAWLIAIGPMDAAASGLESRQHSGLTDMRWALAGYLRWASAAAGPRPYPAHASAESLEPPALGPTPTSPREAAARDLLLAFLAPVLGIEADRNIVLSCTPRAEQVANEVSVTPPASRPPAGAGVTQRLVVRGQIDDLAARAGTDAFKKASSATLAFTDNNEAGTTSLAINGVIGLGAHVGANNMLYGFVQYTLNDQETDAVGDNDDAKDVHNISPGIFYRHPLSLGRSVYGTLGLTGFATFDLRNHAQLIRARLLYSNLAFALPVGSGFLCGQERRLAFLYADCRVGLFLEAAEVLDAGTNADLLANADDEYIGAGAEVGVTFSPTGPAPLRPLTLAVSYRMMAILSGALDNPERLEISLTYTSPAAIANRQAYSFGITRTVGENFETFQHEDLWKLTLGFKF